MQINMWILKELKEVYQIWEQSPHLNIALSSHAGHLKVGHLDWARSFQRDGSPCLSDRSILKGDELSSGGIFFQSMYRDLRRA